MLRRLAPGSLSIQAEAAGAVVGGSIGGAPGETCLVFPEVHADATTDASGVASVPAQDTVPAQGSSLRHPTDEVGLAVDGGQDAVTGLILPVNLSAPPGASLITPATSLLNHADVDATPSEYLVTATDYAYENGPTAHLGQAKSSPGI